LAYSETGRNPERTDDESGFNSVDTDTSKSKVFIETRLDVRTMRMNGDLRYIF